MTGIGLKRLFGAAVIAMSVAAGGASYAQQALTALDILADLQVPV